jgi:hypothetical protein
VHSYDYDAAGRWSADRVTNFGSTDQNVAPTVASIQTTYDDIGRVQTVTSYSTANAEDWDSAHAVNQVKYVYDGWGNVAAEYQAQLHLRLLTISGVGYIKRSSENNFVLC